MSELIIDRICFAVKDKAADKIEIKKIQLLSTAGEAEEKCDIHEKATHAGFKGGTFGFFLPAVPGDHKGKRSHHFIKIPPEAIGVKIRSEKKASGWAHEVGWIKGD